MTEEFALRLLMDYRGYVKKIKQYDELIEGYSVATFNSGSGDLNYIFKKLKRLSDRQGLLMRRIKFVQAVLSKLKKKHRQVLVGYYIRKQDVKVIAEFLDVALSSVYRLKNTATLKFYEKISELEREYSVD